MLTRLVKKAKTMKITNPKVKEVVKKPTMAPLSPLAPTKPRTRVRTTTVKNSIKK